MPLFLNFYLTISENSYVLEELYTQPCAIPDLQRSHFLNFHSAHAAVLHQSLKISTTEYIA